MMLVDYKENPNGVGLLIACMSAAVFVYSILSGMLKRHKYLLLDTLIIVTFSGVFVIACFIAIIVKDSNGFIAACISAICLLLTTMVEMIKVINFYWRSYDERNLERNENIEES